MSSVRRQQKCLKNAEKFEILSFLENSDLSSCGSDGDIFISLTARLQCIKKSRQSYLRVLGRLNFTFIQEKREIERMVRIFNNANGSDMQKLQRIDCSRHIFFVLLDVALNAASGNCAREQMRKVVRFPLRELKGKKSCENELKCQSPAKRRKKPSKGRTAGNVRTCSICAFNIGLRKI